MPVFDDLIQEHSFNQEVSHPSLEKLGIALSIKREDRLHPFVSGNKFRKLKYNFLTAAQQGHRKLLSFGGAYSNHLAALAFAGRAMGFQTIGIVRGEELSDPQRSAGNPTLNFLKAQGMQLHFVSREDYRKKEEQEFLDALRSRFEDFYLIPEGGSNELALKGCQEILNLEDRAFDLICCPVGSGGTAAGLLRSIDSHQQFWGFSCVNDPQLDQRVDQLAGIERKWTMIDRYHLGGFAKVNEKLISFMNDFYRTTTIPLEPLYNGKMLFGLFEMAEMGHIQEGTKILALHTGGLQGITGMNQKLKGKNRSILRYEKDI